MEKKANGLNNVQSAISQFDTMTTSKQQDGSMGASYRPVVKITPTTTFRPDEKPTTDMKPKKKIPVKPIIIGLAIVAVLAAVFIFVPQVNKTLTVTTKGVSTYKTELENKVTAQSINSLIELVGKVPQLATDNAVKGTAKLNITDFGATTFMPNALGGEYTFDFDMTTKAGSTSWLSDIRYNGTELGDFDLYADHASGVVFVKPTMFTEYMELDNAIFLEDCSKFFVQMPEGLQAYFKDVYDGVSWVSLVTTLSADTKINAIIKPYMTLWQSIEYKGGISFDVPADTTATYILEAKSDWGTVKPVFDEILKGLKTDSNMMELVKAAGIKKQYFVSKLGTLSDKLNMYSSSAGDKAEVIQQIYAKDDEIVRYTMLLPCNAEGSYFTLALVNENGVFSLNLTEGTTSILDINFDFAITDDMLTADGCVTYNSVKYYITVQDLKLGAITTGNIEVTVNDFKVVLDLSNTDGQAFDLSMLKGADKICDVSGVLSTYPMTESLRAPNKKLSLYGASKSNIESYISSSMDLTALLDVCNAYYNVYIDETKVLENLTAILTAYSMREYDFELPNADISGVYIDDATKRAELMQTSNNNAANLYFAMQLFIDECLANEKNTYAITNGTYTGYVSEDKADLYYKAEFTQKSMESCIACSIDTGYYCVVIQNNAVLYAFWSANDNIMPLIENKSLPSSFSHFDSATDIIGTYPMPSSLGE